MVMKLRRNLKIRMRGHDVKALQKALVAAGFPVKDTFGRFGQKTKKVVEGIQKRLGLDASGVVDQPLFDRIHNPSIIRGRVTQQNGNRIAGAPVGVEGILLEEPRENGQSLRFLRGWFRLSDDGPDEIQLAPTGRWIQVTVARQTTLTVAPPAWWTHPPQPWSQVRLGSGTHRLWLADGATAVMVNGRSIPVARIGDTLRVDP